MLPSAADARALVLAKNDVMLEFKEKVEGAIIKAINEERLEARIKICETDPNTVREMAAQLEHKGYSTRLTETVEKTKLLVVSFKEQLQPVVQTPQIDYKGIELPASASPIIKEV